MSYVFLIFLPQLIVSKQSVIIITQVTIFDNVFFQIILMVHIVMIFNKITSSVRGWLKYKHGHKLEESRSLEFFYGRRKRVLY